MFTTRTHSRRDRKIDRALSHQAAQLRAKLLTRSSDNVEIEFAAAILEQEAEYLATERAIAEWATRFEMGPMVHVSRIEREVLFGA